MALKMMARRTCRIAVVVLLGTMPLACGGRTVVKGPDDSSGDSPSTPTVSTDGPAKGDSDGGVRKVAKIPVIKPRARDELRRIVAQMARDPEGGEVERVREDKSTGGTIVGLSDSNVQDGDLARLKLIPNLRVLNLANCPFLTGSGLAYLRPLPELRKLSLSRSPIDDDALANLREMSQLVELNLFMTPITDDGLAHLSKCSGLETLMVHQTVITDAGLAHLTGLPNLKDVWLQGTRVTEKGLRQLEAARPGIKLRHRLRTRRRN